jgi:hypothetical protein
MDGARYKLPSRVLSNSAGFEFLAAFAGDTIAISSSNVILDFKGCIWFDGNLCAVLGVILDGLSARQNSIVLENLNRSLHTTFTRNKFLSNFGGNANDIDSLTIPYQKFKLEDEQKAMDFIKTQLFDKPNMPMMSNDAKKSVLVSIFEVIVNAITHGECEHVYVCGQIYPTRNPPEVSLSFVDLGRTIKANVNEHLNGENSGNKTILWALEEGNTTKNGTEPGGIGLKLLQNLVNLNKGSLQIISADGFIELKNTVFKEHLMNDYFPGTIVNIKLRLGDSNFYFLTNEINTENIF